MTVPNRPFRWDLVRRDRLGDLLRDRPEPEFPYPDELVDCAAKVVARSADGDLYFVGRSADSVHDLISGALARTPHRDRLHLLPFSYRLEDPLQTVEVRQLRANLAAVGITPHGLARRKRPIVLTDLVYGGATFTHLYGLLHDWIRDERETWDVIRLKLRFLGITSRKKTSPNTWRWWQNAPWTGSLPRRAVTSVSVEPWLWNYLGNEQHKLTPSFRRTLWADEAVAVPCRDDETLGALAQAVALVELGRSRRVRDDLARRISAEPSFTQAWLRSLTLELRRGDPRGSRLRAAEIR
ncbi:hypothetical protein [Planomonospora sp. ID82291]|uniref:hypothetical protein n=1 Tax=Planomonospora sp. ID82291 TaxID=2738136 RepID=UPI0018C3CF64|nr:hypothetical protein [Planomonospora sp. ID82291]MBG0818855.1 hypothetical protein [Planomonospora sp. ID82291]